MLAAVLPGCSKKQAQTEAKTSPNQAQLLSVLIVAETGQPFTIPLPIMLREKRKVGNTG